jgi:uncharacterized membrane protein YbhN (UPF0104 family)
MNVTPPPVPKTWTKKRLFAWALAIAALSFVVWIVPIRDRCEDPDARSGSTRVAVTPTSDGCVLHIRSGDVVISKEECARLKCEPGLASTFARARLGVVAALFLAYLFGVIAWSARWRMLLTFAGVDVPLAGLVRITLEAQAGGILLPGGVGGDALRVAFVVGRGAPTPIAIASVMLDRVIGLVTLAGIAAALGLGFGGAQVGVVAWILAAIPFGAALGLFLLRSERLRGLRVLNAGRIGKLAQPILTYVAHPAAPRAIAFGLLVSLVVSAVQLGVVRGLVFALGGAPSDERWVFVGTAMAFIVSAIPALPGGWGTSDAAFVFFLGLGGLPAGIALASGLLYRLFWYLLGMVGAILYLARSRARSAQRE